MRYAIVSDIHANRQAWDAVREDIAGQGIDATLCLGDIVGYGPRPAEVLECVWEHAADIVLGNHDAVAGGRLDPEDFNDNAQRMIHWTMDMIDTSVRRVLAELPSVLEGDGFTLAHAELADPERYGYIETPEEVAENFEAGDQPILFVGHSHDPRIFMLDKASGGIGELPLHTFAVRDDRRYIVNVGSVGDPRDGRTLASYCLYDSDTRVVSHRSVAFDVEAFRADLDACRVPVKPWFLQCWDRQVAGARRIDAWSAKLRTLARPKKRVEEERIAAETALKQQREWMASVTRQSEERKRMDEAKSATFAERLRERQKATAKARQFEKEEQAKLLRQRKLELAKAAELRMLAAREARETEQNAERARIREQIERKKRLAAEKKTRKKHDK